MRRLIDLSLLVVLLVFTLIACKPGEDPRRKPADNGKDVSTKDANTKDVGAKDAGAKDAPVKDTGAKDAGAKDAGTKDAATKDAGDKNKPAKDGKAATPVPLTPAIASPYTILQEKSDRLLVVLPNRLIVVAQEIRSAPVVSAQVWIKTGSIYEQEHVGAGLSHYLEHLLSGGTTTTRPEEETNKILGRIGARTNAATSLQNVWYYINTTREHGAEAVGLLSDWMMNSKIEQKEFDRERDVIQREFDMGQGDPERILWKLMQQARYKTHPARHPTIGYLDEFLKITRDEIYNFYKRMYVPNNMVFVVTGDIDKKKIVEQIAALWKDAKPGKLPELSFPVEPALEAPRELSGVADVRRPRLRLAWPGTKLAAKGDYAMDLLAVILGQGESSRLVRTVRDQQRLVNSVSSYNQSFTWGEGFFGVEADVAIAPPKADEPVEQIVKDGIAKAKAAILAEIARIQKDGVTADELARAKRQTIAQVIYSAQTAEDMAERLAHDIIGMGDPDYLAKYAKAIQGITADEVKAVANQYLNAQRSITLTLLPSASGDPPPPLKRLPDEVDAATLKREPFDLDNSEILTAINARGKQAAADENPAVYEAIQRKTLSNGLRVLVGRNTLIPAVAIELYHAGGLLIDEPGLEGVANATSTMMIKGTKTRTAQDIAKAVESLGAGLVTQCGNNTHFTKANCLKEDWQTVMELLADVTLNPTFPADEWTKLQPRLVAAIERQSDTWDGELGLRFREAMFKSHPWQTRPVGRAEVVSALKPENLAAFHKKFISADQSVLAVFGDVNPDEVFKKAEELLGKLPAKAAEPFKPALLTFPPAGQIVNPTRKATTAVMVGMGPTIARTHEDYAALQVLTNVISDFPSGWLEQELRGRGPGLAYAVWAYQVTGVIPGYAAAGFNCGADVVDEAIKRTLSVIERAKTEDIDDATVARAKAATLTSELFGKQSNGDRATEAALNTMYGLPADEQERFIAAVNKLDAKALKAAGQKYLVNPVVVVIKQQAAPAAPKTETK